MSPPPRAPALFPRNTQYETVAFEFCKQANPPPLAGVELLLNMQLRMVGEDDASQRMPPPALVAIPSVLPLAMVIP
jgi:hypothetical protein